MARTLRDTKLETRTARDRLAARHKPYWRLMSGGIWQARYFLGDGKYAETALGMADDVRDADGETVLSFSDAQAKARAWFVSLAKQEAVTPTRAYSVNDVLDEYLAWYGDHRRSADQVAYVVNAHIRPEIGAVRIVDLSGSAIRAFHEKVAKRPARVRTRDGAGQQYAASPETPEKRRQRRATANRILTTLKAALNRAYHEGQIASDDAWRRVKPFRNVDVARVRYLSVDECRALVVACPDDFGRVVRATLLTGCRYGELTVTCLGTFIQR